VTNRLARVITITDDTNISRLSWATDAKHRPRATPNDNEDRITQISYQDEGVITNSIDADDNVTQTIDQPSACLE